MIARCPIWSAVLAGVVFSLVGMHVPPAMAAPTSDAELSPLVDAAWLADHLGDTDLKIVDLRATPKYNAGHIPGAISLNPESFRGAVGGDGKLFRSAAREIKALLDKEGVGDMPLGVDVVEAALSPRPVSALRAPASELVPDQFAENPVRPVIVPELPSVFQRRAEAGTAEERDSCPDHYPIAFRILARH